MERSPPGPAGRTTVTRRSYQPSRTARFRPIWQLGMHIWKKSAVNSGSRYGGIRYSLPARIPPPTSVMFRATWLIQTIRDCVKLSSSHAPSNGNDHETEWITNMGAAGYRD